MARFQSVASPDRRWRCDTVRRLNMTANSESSPGAETDRVLSTKRIGESRGFPRSGNHWERLYQFGGRTQTSSPRVCGGRTHTSSSDARALEAGAINPRTNANTATERRTRPSFLRAPHCWSRRRETSLWPSFSPAAHLGMGPSTSLALDGACVPQHSETRTFAPSSGSPRTSGAATGLRRARPAGGRRHRLRRRRRVRLRPRVVDAVPQLRRAQLRALGESGRCWEGEQPPTVEIKYLEVWGVGLRRVLAAVIVLGFAPIPRARYYVTLVYNDSHLLVWIRGRTNHASLVCCFRSRGMSDLHGRACRARRWSRSRVYPPLLVLTD